MEILKYEENQYKIIKRENFFLHFYSYRNRLKMFRLKTSCVTQVKNPCEAQYKYD